jgi:hypothetical protein
MTADTASGQRSKVTGAAAGRAVTSGLPTAVMTAPPGRAAS